MLRCKIAVVSVLGLLLIAAVSRGQDEITLYLQGLQAEGDIGESTQLILDDPSLGSSVYDSEGGGDRKDEKGDGGGGGGGVELTAGVVSVFSQTTKSYNIPINFRLGRWDVGASVPYVYERKFEYASGTAKTSGIGDANLNLGYGLGMFGRALKVTFMFKLPTGDAEAEDGGMLVPLGTGSTDYGISLSSMEPNLFTGKFSWKTMFRMNSAYTRTYTSGTSQMEETTRNGNIFFATGTWERPVHKLVDALATIVFLSTSDGTREINNGGEVTLAQSITIMDFTPGAKVYLGPVAVKALVAIPIVTDRPGGNGEDDREISFRLGANYLF